MDIAPKENAGGKQIIYFHGGAYVNSFASQHWAFISKLMPEAKQVFREIVELLEVRKERI